MPVIIATTQPDRRIRDAPAQGTTTTAAGTTTAAPGTTIAVMAAAKEAVAATTLPIARIARFAIPPRSPLPITRPKYTLLSGRLTRSFPASGSWVIIPRRGSLPMPVYLRNTTLQLTSERIFLNHLSK